MQKQYIAIDQYGQIWKNLEHPRKDLMEKIGCTHAEKMYIDGNDGRYITLDTLLAVYG